MKIKVVFIEDSPISQEVIKLFFDSFPHLKLVAIFNNGQDFLNVMDKLEVDVIVTDIGMPIIDGITMTKFALDKQPDLKIIAYSLFNNRKYAYDAISAGIKSYVLKDQSNDVLASAIDKVNSGGNYINRSLLKTHNVRIDHLNIIKKASKFGLSAQETHIIRYMCYGYSNDEIAEKLKIERDNFIVLKSKLLQQTNNTDDDALIFWAIFNNVVVA